MRIFKTRWLGRFARRFAISDAMLVEAIRRAEAGMVDADLGGGVIKQRIGRPGQGRSGGYRTLIAFRAGDRAVFLFAFAKNERDNVSANEVVTMKQLATMVLGLDERQLQQALIDGRIEEIAYGKQ
jgi:hypothetical protein